jgi:acetylornithine deacetylase/succinyl-diaminopimelate desuccinylase
VPDRCLIKIDRRWIPGETSDGVYMEFLDIINNIKNEDKDFEAYVFRDESGINDMEHGPVFMESQDRHVIQLLNCIKRTTGKDAEVDVFPGWTEASLLSNFGNIPTLIYGAGDIGTAHSEKECVNIDDLYNSALVYGEVMLDYEGRE